MKLSKQEFNEIFKDVDESRIKKSVATSKTRKATTKKTVKKQTLKYYDNPKNEHEVQVNIITRCKKEKDPRYKMIFAIPNGGARSKTTGAKLKDEGVKRGVPDLCLPVATMRYGSLFIEMKYGRNKPSDVQKEVMSDLTTYGNKCEVCYTEAEAMEVIHNYLEY